MTRRTKLCWTELPRRALRDGLACQAGGARVMLLPAEDRKADEPPPGSKSGAEPDAAPQPAADRPR